MAFVVCHVSVVDCPLLMVSGLAVNEAVGAAGGGGGGGGGGGCFLWHAPRNRIALSANTRAIVLSVSCFNFSSRILVRYTTPSHHTYQELCTEYKYQVYFQLQSGSELAPDVVICFWLVPSASIVQI